MSLLLFGLLFFFLPLSLKLYLFPDPWASVSLLIFPLLGTSRSTEDSILGGWGQSRPVSTRGVARRSWRSRHVDIPAGGDRQRDIWQFLGRVFGSIRLRTLGMGASRSETQ